MATAIDELLTSAWAEHGDHPEPVAERLSTSIGVIQTREEFAPYVRLLTHVYGEHLGRWQEAVVLLDRMRELPAFDGSPEVASTIDHARATMRFASGDATLLQALPREAQVSALATAASALAARDDLQRAIASYESAVALAAPGLPDASPALRALAVGGNNLAVVLEGKTERDALQTEGMLFAAEAGVKYWKLAGTWLEAERAEYRLARCQLRAGKAREAVASAGRCIAICRQNAAPAFEQFFGFAVSARAQRGAGDGVGSDESRAEAMRQLELISSEERHWCTSDLVELNAMA